VDQSETGMRKRIAFACLTCLLGAALAGCTRTDSRLAGAGAGAAAGAVVAGPVGAAVGGVTGAIVGPTVARKSRRRY
jgi:osmotically inducible lipoprotein OsmB